MINKKKKDWFRNRGYLHVTNRISDKEKFLLEKYISNPKKIQSHRFTPFILRQTTVRRFKHSDKLNRRSQKSVNDKGELVNNSKVRPITYATHIDSNVMSFYSQNIIQPKYEAYLKRNVELDQAITAYRQIESDDGVRFRYNVDFAKEVFDEIKSRKNCAVLAFDIENFFPSLNHKVLKQLWCKILGTKSLPKDHYNLYKAITKFSYFYYDDLRLRYKGNLDEKKIAHLKINGKFQFFEDYKDFKESGIQVYKNQLKTLGEVAGIPQGLPISALLANLYMLPFDEDIISQLVSDKKCYYRRYSDDLVVLCDIDEIDIVEEFVLQSIKNINLNISPSKTEKFVFRTNENRLECFKLSNEKEIPNSYLQYLGFDFYGHKTIIKSANLSRFYREMKQSISMKSNRIDKIQEKNLTDERIVYKRKIYRLYSFKGMRSRSLPATKLIHTQQGLKTRRYSRKYRGNFIKYAYRASEIMDAPEIKRQVRRHMIILKKYMSKFDFDNAPKFKQNSKNP